MMLAAVASGCVRSVDEDETNAAPLLPLETLLAAPAVDGALVSPDGQWLSWLAATEAGAMNLRLAPVESPEEGRWLTTRVGRGLQGRDVSGNLMIRWTSDSRRIVFPQDSQGDENWNLFVVDVESGVERQLTDFSGVRVRLLGLGEISPDQALISINDRDAIHPDLYRIDLETGHTTLLERNERFLGHLGDRSLRPRLAWSVGEGGALDLWTSAGDGTWEFATSLAAEDLPALSMSGSQGIFQFDGQQRELFLYDSRGRDTSALVSWNLDDGSVREIARDPRTDPAGVLYHPSEHRPQAWATAFDRQRWIALDPEIAADLERLAGVDEGDFRVVSRSDDDGLWIVRFTLAHEPERYALYRRPEGTIEDLFVTTPQLAGIELSPMHSVVTESRDGFPLVSYLSLPPWTDHDGDGRPSEPVPLVLLVHGGPSDERAQYAYGPFVHWLTNRGYGVFYVNFRGSPGFGKAFMNAQRMEWGGKMHEDLLDQVDWAIEEGITRRDRVGILGGSYGGYAVLVAMTMTPEVFACGIDLVGPSNLEVFMPHWDVDLMSATIGDPRTEEGRAHLRSRSPVRFAHQVVGPLLIGQGARDSRVPQAQSDEMVAAMVAVGAPVTYAVFSDEGHGFVREANNLAFWGIAEVFLESCLGGRAAPIDRDLLEASSVKVPVGAEHVQGLAEALAVGGR